MTNDHLNSLNFSAETFRQFVEHWSEGPRLDFKEAMYQYGGDKVEQFKFAKDVIAFANVARRTGQPCYIVFGVRNGTREICDVRGQFPNVAPPKGATVKDEQADYVLQPLLQTAGNWVSPHAPSMTLEHGLYDGKFVSWLEVIPDSTDTEQPFALKKAHNNFGVGAVFIRQGSANTQVDPRVASHLLRASQAAYLRQAEWARLIEHHRTDADFRNSWRLPNFAPFKDARRGDAHQAVLDDLAVGKQVIAVRASAGIGKTVLLQRLAYDLAQQHPAHVTEREYYGQADSQKPPEATIDDLSVLEVAPKLPVPLFISLRESFSSIEQFKHHLCQRANERMQTPDKIRTAESLFAILGSRWVLLLDGMDELGNRETFGEALKTWLKNLCSNVQVILSSRPYAFPEEVAEGAINLQPLTREEIDARLQGKVNAEDLRRLQSFFVQRPDLYDLAQRHRALDGLMKRAQLRQPEDADSPAIQDTSSIDQVVVKVVQPEFITTPQTEGDSNVPVIGVEASASEDPSIVSAEPLPETEEAVTELSLAETLGAMVEEMVEKERRRRMDERLAALAREHLQRVAWHTDWRKARFSPHDCDEKGWWNVDTRRWNEDIGFVEQAAARGSYRFAAALLHCYMAAEYADEKEVATIRDTLKEREPDHPNTQTVIRLLAELRAEFHNTFSL